MFSLKKSAALLLTLLALSSVLGVQAEESGAFVERNRALSAGSTQN
ncbi:hypothetical protein [Pseudomonas chlororaphis]|nr:hypothetical protein [Pseudomonas chlororaphis]AZD85172.1 hypothetical protein C4K14_2348 [Pseudomonas chlororaphis subsp. aureofaciens]MBP5065468.1 hypothetical protein [Pseudomonas chlororaphis]QTT93885.1 hypothetical protein HUT27_10520 [Pseudomonas chlororaphis]WDG50332.1 hypothetical protein PUP58_11305 [Pseudomonas chlororaphis]